MSTNTSYKRAFQHIKEKLGRDPELGVANLVDETKTKYQLNDEDRDRIFWDALALKKNRKDNS